MSEYTAYVQHYRGQLMDNFSVCALAATASALLLDYTGGDAEAFITWLLMSMTDCILGVYRAVILGIFSAKKLHRWTMRVGTQLIIVFLVAAVGRMLTLASGKELLLTNWVLLFFAFFDFSTAIDKLILLNAPVPKFVIAFVELLRRRSTRILTSSIGGNDEDAAKLDKALRPPRTRKKKGDTAA